MNRTLKDWLLERHADGGPELDALRRAVLPEPRLSGREFLRELFVPSRQIWAAVAVAWIALLALNPEQPSPPQPERPAVPQYAVAWPTTTTQLDEILAETRTYR